MNLNLLKGILILLVIVDHNDFARSIFPGFLLGFAFHVVGFMTIPFLKPAPALDRAMGPYLFRLYWPFVVMTGMMAAAVVVLDHVPAPLQAERWLLTLYSGNSAVLKQTTGMALLWYLPSFVSLVLLRSAIERAGQPVKALTIALLCVAHLFIGPVAPVIRDYLPLGVLPALYVIPLGYLCVWAHRRLFERMPPLLALVLATAVFIPIKYLQIRANLYNEVGFTELASYRAPGALMLNDLESVFGVLMLFQLCRFEFGAFVQACGRYSIQIYLFHAFIGLGIYKAVLRFAPELDVLAQFAISVAATAALTLLLARWLAERRLVQRFLFPRGLHVLLKGESVSAHRMKPLAAKS